MARLSELALAVLAAPVLGLTACLPPLEQSAACPGSDTDERILLTTTDFSTGWARVFDPQNCTLGPEILASSDVIPLVVEQRPFLVHRFGTDRLDELQHSGDELDTVGSIRIEVHGVGSVNAQSVAVGADGRRYVAMYNAPEIQVFEPGAESVSTRLDVSALAEADPDGVPEISWIGFQDGQLVAIVRSLDQGSSFTTFGPDRLELLSPQSGESLGTIALPGTWTRQVRHDPEDPSILYGLSNSLQRIDLATQTAETLIDEATFAAFDLDDPLLPQSFAIDWSSGAVFIAAYDPGFTGVTLYRSSLEGGPLEPIADGLDAVERTLEVIDGVVWFGDRRIGQEGLHAFGADGTDLSQGAFPTGLPPYSMTSL